MSKYRRTRINDEVTRVVAEAIRTVKDPRVAGAMITITKADVTGDLKFAKVYYSAMQGDKKEVAAGLRSSAGFIRREIARRLNLRMTPEFTFVEDHSIEHGAHISKLLNSIEITPEEDENGDGEL